MSPSFFERAIFGFEQPHFSRKHLTLSHHKRPDLKQFSYTQRYPIPLQLGATST